MSSPGTGVQHFASRTRTSSTPITLIPYVSLPTASRARLLDGDGLLRDLAHLELLEDLVDDLRGGELSRAERDVEVLRLLEARLADHAREHRRAGELLVREVLALERILERLAALRLEILLLLAREELADLVARPRGRDEREPVAGRAARGRLAREDLDAVAAAQVVVERHDPAV